MSWMQELYQVYENNCGKQSDENVLLPVSHSTANAQIEIVLDEDGFIVNTERIENKEISATIIPVTEDSGSRSSGIAPHPLEDKLIYIAKDYINYVGGKKSDNSLHYETYINNLKLWKESDYSSLAVDAIYSYLVKGTIMKDLIERKVLLIDEETGLLKENEKILGINQEDSFVRFRILYKNDLSRESCVWKDNSLYDSYKNYNISVTKDVQLCYATGKMLACTYKHPSKIRNAGDKAKLISSNDESGFTYRGRFSSKEEAISVSYDFSQKMHNALKWLISKQGVSIGTMTLVVWESNLVPMPNIFNDLDYLYDEEWGEDDVSEDVLDIKNNDDTLVAYRNKVHKAVWGKKETIDVKSKAIIMMLDAATTGRLAMTMYTEMETSLFLKNIEKWHQDISWIRFNGKKKKNEISSFSLYNIAEFIGGTEQGDFVKCKPEIKNDIMMRLIKCVIEGRDIPRDIISSIVNKASNPLAYKKHYNYRTTLELACGLVRKYKIDELRKRGKEGVCTMALDYKCTTRDYLYGRLLAVADAVEAATYEKGEERTTNAKRYFESFANRPYQTWDVIYKRISPYLVKLNKGQQVYYNKLIQEIMDKFERDNFINNTKLMPEFLHAYSCQLNEIYKKKDGEE